jgi:hypothetical protein
MTRTFQQILFTPQTEWVVPEELKDLRGHKEIAVDLETCDPELTGRSDRGTWLVAVTS